MKKILYAGIAILSLFFSYIAPAQTDGDGVKLVLIGLVCQEDGQGIENVEVKLEDNKSKQIQSFASTEDGQFYFQLEAEKQYSLFYMNPDNRREEVKTISTVNKKDPEILRAVLVMPESILTGNLVYGVDRPETYGTSIEEVYQGLVFKIQIGAFRHELSKNSAFLQGLERRLTTEKALNGFTRYLIGTFPTLEEAEKYEKVLHYKGYDKAYIVAYKNGKRTSESIETVIQKYNLR